MYRPNQIMAVFGISDALFFKGITSMASLSYLPPYLVSAVLLRSFVLELCVSFGSLKEASRREGGVAGRPGRSHRV